jgi:hypothetical protein
MRETGVRGVLVYCSDCRCSHWIAISGDQWLDGLRLTDIEPSFVCQACGTKGANLRLVRGHGLSAHELTRICAPAVIFIKESRHLGC